MYYTICLFFLNCSYHIIHGYDVENNLMYKSYKKTWIASFSTIHVLAQYLHISSQATIYRRGPTMISNIDGYCCDYQHKRLVDYSQHLLVPL